MSARKDTQKSTKKQIILFAAVTVFMCALALCSLFLVIRSFLPVTEFELFGMTQYSKAELLGHAGIEAGDKLYSIDFDKAEQMAKQSCPYISKITFERVFPNKLKMTVEEKTPMWYISVSGDCYVLDEEFKVIEETTAEQRLIALGVPRLVLPSIKSLVVGNVPKFGKDETEIRKALELIVAVQSTSFKSRVTLVDMDSRFDVSVVVDGIYEVYMGDTSNIKEKLDTVEDILNTEELRSYAGAKINVSVPETVSIKPVYSYE